MLRGKYGTTPAYALETIAGQREVAEASCFRTVCVYLGLQTGARLAACSIQLGVGPGTALRRDESRRGTHECVRYLKGGCSEMGLGSFGRARRSRSRLWRARWYMRWRRVS